VIFRLGIALRDAAPCPRNIDRCGHMQPPPVYAPLDSACIVNACWMRQRGLCGVATFDKKHYSRFEGIAVHTPGEG
jgi:hypothetical protein